MLTINDVAERLRVSVATVRKWVLTRRIPFLKVGALVRFDPEVIARIEREGLK